jgi:surface polysaccharide O-acyltransferase-like enzyme
VALNSGLKAGLYFYGYLSITVIPMSISLMYLLKHLNKVIISKNITSKLSALTLGVYLIHPAILDIVYDLTYILYYRHPLISVLAVTSFILIVSLGIAWVLNQIPFLRRTI